MAARQSHSLFYYMLFLPALLVVGYLTVYPIGRILTDSFFEYDYIAGIREFVGVSNYVRIGSDNGFRVAVRNTTVFAATATALEVAVGFLLALLFYGRFRGKRVATIMTVFPMMFSTMVVTAVWRTLYHFEIGLFNATLRGLGFPAVPWLIDARIALFSVVLTDVWQWTPFVFIILHAALNTVPRELFEAAAIDGAGTFALVRRVVVPVLAPQLLLVAMLRTIDTFRLFSKVYALTGGGPGNATETVSYFIYREAFSYFNLGRAATGSVFALVVVGVFAFFYIPRLLQEDTR
jgi:multiple sugar transport system permease protein